MTQTSSPGLLSSDPLISLLDRAQVKKSSLIRVTGPNGLSALLWLCRHGYETVGYLRDALAELVALAEALAHKESHHGLG